MKFALPGRVPFRLRFFFRAAFALLAFATLALATAVLRDEKQRSQRDELEALHQHVGQIAARLRHPTGQLALLNVGATDQPPPPLHPLLLPFSAIDFDDKAKAQQAVEMAGCSLQYPDGATLCIAVGNNPSAGGFIYVVGSFVSDAPIAHLTGDLDLTHATRVRIDVSMRGQHFAWLAPFEALPMDPNSPGVRGRLTGYPADRPVLPGARSVRDFRGWLWQDGRCADAAKAGEANASGVNADRADAAANTDRPDAGRPDADRSTADDCPRRSFMSVRLPIELFRDDLYAKRLVWPPPDLARIDVRVRMLAPGDAKPVFDSDAAGAQLPFSLADLRALLKAGETLQVRKLQGDGSGGEALLTLSGAIDAGDHSSPWMLRLINRLPVDDDAPVKLEARETVVSSLVREEIVLTGDPRVLQRQLAAVATRLSWFIGAMLLAVLLTWLAIEIRIIRRITLLTRRAAVVSTGMRASDDLARIDVRDLRGSDELGVLAGGLGDLLQRVNEDVRRERIRAAQDKDLWHAVGHEIMSPLQSLMALHGSIDDASHRYIARMQQAVRVLYGHASPTEAFEASTLQLQPLDLGAFLSNVAANTGYIGIEQVVFEAPTESVMVRADEFPLEDAITHVLRNAQRHRLAGTPITLTLRTTDDDARIVVHNQGSPIPAELLAQVFDYGVSDQETRTDSADTNDTGRRGQGLFVARTYMAKMGGTISALNTADGVVFELVLPRVAAPV